MAVTFFNGFFCFAMKLVILDRYFSSSFCKLYGAA